MDLETPKINLSKKDWRGRKKNFRRSKITAIFMKFYADLITRINTRILKILRNYLTTRASNTILNAYLLLILNLFEIIFKNPAYSLLITLQIWSYLLPRIGPLGRAKTSVAHPTLLLLPLFPKLLLSTRTLSPLDEFTDPKDHIYYISILRILFWEGVIPYVYFNEGYHKMQRRRVRSEEGG